MSDPDKDTQDFEKVLNGIRQEIKRKKPELIKEAIETELAKKEFAKPYYEKEYLKCLLAHVLLSEEDDK